MAGSLQDQLLGAGLSNKQKAKKINTAKKKAVKKSRKENTTLENKATLLAEQARAAQRLKSQTLNAKHQQAVEQKAIAAQICQIIEMNSIEKLKGKQEQPYQFTDENKIKTLYVSVKNHDLISRGSLAIAKLEQDYHLIPKQAAHKISERDSHCIVLLNDPLQQQDTNVDDDPYADYKIPDDLMW
ncbi:MAG: DUF2058 domain-containing protein [Cocleimonas sp.]|nr:DUF2058 domain-containing protein [Cocleimonas sp.]